jgi:AcrR family transcriptional regulator
MLRHREIIRERKRREKDQRIQGILKAAKEVFFSKGYMKSTMDEIAYAAQISKPTIYQYFRTKDELYSALMLPFLEEFGSQFERIKKKLDAGKYADGTALVKDIFKGFKRSYDAAPDSLRVANSFFQQSDLISALGDDTRLAISSRGRYDFELARGLLEKAMELGLLRRMDPYALSDIIWAMLLGITQVMDMKATRHTRTDRHLRSTLQEAERLLCAAIAL